MCETTVYMRRACACQASTRVRQICAQANACTAYSSLRVTARSYVVIQTYLAGGAIYDYARLATSAHNRSRLTTVVI